MSEENNANHSEENNTPNYEDLASAAGWVPKEEWTEAGKDPEEWTTAKRFHKTGESIKANKKLHGQVESLNNQIVSLTNQHQSDINGLKTFQNAQLHIQRQELMDKRSEAIESADSEKVKEIEGQVNALDYQAQNIQQTEDPRVRLIRDGIDKYAKQNPWVNDGSAKAKLANAILMENFNTFNSIDGALEDMTKQVNNAFPETNENREKLSMTSKGGTTKKSSGGKVSMSSLSSQQQEIFNQFYKSSDPKINEKNTKEFLKQCNVSEG